MTEAIPFSTVIRERATASHSHAEHSGLMADLMKGQASQDEYTGLVAQHWFIYQALEEGVDRMRANPVAAPFLSNELTRLPALERDLAFLLGDNWRTTITPLDATARYTALIRGSITENSSARFIAHHYTRYLGDLSGGQFIGKIVARTFGFDGDGVHFYTFDDIADPSAFKDEYRQHLDAAAWDDSEKEQLIAEVLEAYQCNNDVFDDLTRAKLAA